MKSVKKANLPQFLEALNSKRKAFVPVTVNGISQFAPWDKEAELVLEGNTLLPPKGLFFPQTEEMYEYRVNKQEGSIQDLSAPPEPFVVFGMRPCDVHAMKVLDDVFLTKGYEDVYYKQKREQGLIMALGCTEPCETCFCDAWGINPARAPLADVMMMEKGDSILLAPQSGAGEKLLADLAGRLAEEAGELPEGKPCTLKVKTEGLMEHLQPKFEHQVWEEICRKCVNCGTCTYLCPTCHCFDILNRTRGNCGVKYRCYDSCMYAEYTLMAGGHNPRPSKKERVRQRFLHKLQYIPERYSEVGCVGCGRCIQKCPVNLDITRVISQLWEVE